jgi:hypothetical protein
VEENKIADLVKKGDTVIYKQYSAWNGTCYKLCHVKNVTKAGRVRIEETNELTDLFGNINYSTKILPVSQETLLEYNNYNLKRAIRNALNTLNRCIMNVTSHYDDTEELAQQVYSLLETVHNKVGTEVTGVDLVLEMDKLKDLLQELKVLTTEDADVK